MSTLLCIETATEICSVCISKEGKLIAIRELNEGYTHAGRITILIQELLNETQLSWKDIDAIAVSKGPGSYTGLRVGVSTAKGLCYALQKPLIAVNTLHAIAHHTKHLLAIQPDSMIVPMIDARRMEVYCCVMNGALEPLQPTEAHIVQTDSFDHWLNKGMVYFTGNGAAKCKEILVHPNAIFPDEILCTSKGMIPEATQRFLQNEFEDVAYFVPYYLKSFVGTQPRKKV